MAKAKHLVIDAWIREAQEAAKLVEDIETRVKNRNIKQQQQHSLGDDIARSKLLEAGVKLDRLESLLHNPPSKPILTSEDLEYRWNMLSDIQLRTKSLAMCLYAVPSSNRSGGLPVAETNETNKRDNIYDHDQNKASVSENEPELLKSLISDDAPLGHMQMKHSMPLFRKVCWIICIILVAAAFLFVLIILCAVI